MSKAVRKNVRRIADLASAHFSTLHGRKMCGPRNETERVLLEISTLAEDVLNALAEHHTRDSTASPSPHSAPAASPAPPRTSSDAATAEAPPAAP